MKCAVKLKKSQNSFPAATNIDKITRLQLVSRDINTIFRFNK